MKRMFGVVKNQLSSTKKKDSGASAKLLEEARASSQLFDQKALQSKDSLYRKLLKAKIDKYNPQQLFEYVAILNDGVAELTKNSSLRGAKSLLKSTMGAMSKVAKYATSPEFADKPELALDSLTKVSLALLDEHGLEGKARDKAISDLSLVMKNLANVGAYGNEALKSQQALSDLDSNLVRLGTLADGKTGRAEFLLARSKVNTFLRRTYPNADIPPSIPPKNYKSFLWSSQVGTNLKTGNETIAVYPGGTIDNDAKNSLNNGRWLQDKVVTWQCAEMAEKFKDDPGVYIMDPAIMNTLSQGGDVVKFISKGGKDNDKHLDLLPPEARKADLLICPLNDKQFNLDESQKFGQGLFREGGSHWTLLVRYKGEYFHFNSMIYLKIKSSVEKDALPNRAATNLESVLSGNPNEKPTVHRKFVEKQKNGSDCGVHMIEAARILGEKYVQNKDAFSVTDVPKIKPPSTVRTELQGKLATLEKGYKPDQWAPPDFSANFRKGIAPHIPDLTGVTEPEKSIEITWPNRIVTGKVVQIKDNFIYIQPDDVKAIPWVDVDTGKSTTAFEYTDPEVIQKRQEGSHKIIVDQLPIYGFPVTDEMREPGSRSLAGVTVGDQLRVTPMDPTRPGPVNVEVLTQKQEITSASQKKEFQVNDAIKDAIRQELGEKAAYTEPRKANDGETVKKPFYVDRDEGFVLGYLKQADKSQGEKKAIVALYGEQLEGTGREFEKLATCAEMAKDARNKRYKDDPSFKSATTVTIRTEEQRKQYRADLEKRNSQTVKMNM